MILLQSQLISDDSPTRFERKIFSFEQVRICGCRIKSQDTLDLKLHAHDTDWAANVFNPTHTESKIVQTKRTSVLHHGKFECPDVSLGSTIHSMGPHMNLALTENSCWHQGVAIEESHVYCRLGFIFSLLVGRLRNISHEEANKESLFKTRKKKSQEFPHLCIASLA